MAAMDLESIASYIARDSRYYSAAFVREVRQAARSLRRFAERGSIVPEIGREAIRELYLGQYRLIYQVTKKKVFILGLIHGARDLRALWDRERRSGLEEA
jgi:plasmid stabilization system protein ParE